LALKAASCPLRMLRIVPFLPLGYGRLTCTLYLCPVFGEYYTRLMI
jgi:hypothetical protein